MLFLTFVAFGEKTSPSIPMFPSYFQNADTYLGMSFGKNKWVEANISPVNFFAKVFLRRAKVFSSLYEKSQIINLLFTMLMNLGC